MAVLGQFVAIYAGTKTGIKKNNPSEQWAALTFRCMEAYKGVRISEQQIQAPNLTIFPPDNFDFGQFEPGKKYVLSLAVMADKFGLKYQYVEHKLVQ